MSSQSYDRQNKRDHHSSPSSDANNNNHPSSQPAPTAPPSQPPNNINQSPVNGYPPAMGYPPHMMYPNGPYPGYPPPPQGYNQYPYEQDPVAPFPNQGCASPRRAPFSGFIRGILLAIIVLIVLSIVTSLITWAILRPRIPVFHVDYMSVSNFNTSSNPFTATWDTNLTVENPNHKLKFYFDRTAVDMFYDGGDFLASSSLDPVFLETKTKTTIQAVMSANGLAQNTVPTWVANEMGKDRAAGSVTFALGFRVVATFKSGSWWTRSMVIKVSCEDLKVDFVGTSGNGALAPEKRHDCEVKAH